MAGDVPVLIEVTRGGMVESRHRGSFAVVDSAGRVVHAAGRIDTPVYARSAIKPLQALPLVESGAADHYGLGPREIALACASHKGEVRHTVAVAHWLSRVGLDPGDLECGEHLPYDPTASHDLIRAGRAPTALNNNCSGKHTGFLTTARHLGERTRGYIEADHPVQQRLVAVLEAMTGLDLARAPRGRDGCGIPVIGFSLAGMARGMARLADPAGLEAERAAASRRILDAMAAEPFYVDGTGGFCRAAMTAAPATVRVKGGAEGVYCASLPTLGLGIAVKIEDGAGRAAELTMATLLDRLGCFDEAQRTELAPYLAPVLRNVAGVEVGGLRAAPDFVL
jgi:L-asparaginase II